MSGSPPLSLDHVGIIVQDLDEGAARWNRLGFRLSPRSPQMGLATSGRFEPWATANHCAVLERGYLELIGVHRPECPNPWASFLERFEGGHIAALRCTDAERAYAALAQRSEDFDPPVPRRRAAPWHTDGDWHSREMRFRNIFSRDARVPECRYIVIEHETPEVVWQPVLMTHPNGASGLASIAYAADDPEPILRRLETLCEVSRSEEAGSHRVRLPDGGTLEVLESAAFAGRYPGAERPPSPSIVGIGVTVDDIARTEDWLAEHRHAAPVLGRGERSLWVGPRSANGIVIEFREGDA
jgi:catechol 2,3-dioxygenase-like lactoylglutathione lyase family enzyme